MLAIVALLAGSALAADKPLTLSGENTKVEFVGSKKDGKHNGGFKKLTGTATAKGTDPTTLSLNVVIDANSLYSDDQKLTAHLKSPDFFDVKRHPEAKFESTGVTKEKEGYKLSGKFTLHGETKELSFPADISVAPDGLKLAAKFTIDRNEWGISFGQGQINDEVAITLTVATKK